MCRRGTPDAVPQPVGGNDQEAVTRAKRHFGRLRLGSDALRLQVGIADGPAPGVLGGGRFKG